MQFLVTRYKEIAKDKLFLNTSTNSCLTSSLRFHECMRCFLNSSNPIIPKKKKFCGKRTFFKMTFQKLGPPNICIFGLNHLITLGSAVKIKFSIKDFFSKCDQIRMQETADLVTFTEKILTGKLHFCAVRVVTCIE